MMVLKGYNKPKVEYKPFKSEGRPVVCEQDGAFTVTMSEMCRIKHINISQLYKHLHGEKPHAKGYTFHYTTEEELDIAAKLIGDML